jgi:hypothetical protein
LFSKSKKFYLLFFTATSLVVMFFALVNHQYNLGYLAFAFKRGVTAAISGLTLNNGTGNLVHGNDITSQVTDLSPDSGAYNWTSDGNRLMVLNMPFDSSTTSQSDLSGGAHAGAVNGAIPIDAGCQVGSCMTFDGNDYIGIPNSADWNFTDTITISLWANRAVNNPAAALGVGGSTYTSLIWLSGDGTFDSAGIYIHTSSSTEYSVGCSTSFGGMWNGSWQHIVGVYNRSLPSDQLRFYVNGVFCSSVTVANEALLGVGGNGVDLGRWPQSTSYLTGKLDEVQIYSRALSAAQIAQLYQDGIAGLGGPTIIHSEETSVGQLWSLAVTPVSTSGIIGSPITSSNGVFLAAGVSNITGVLDNSDEGSPIISALTIPVGSTSAYQWRINSANYAALNLPFNSGSNQTDVSGNANTGTVQTGAAWTDTGCKVGGCVSFNGTTGYISVPDSTSLSTTGSLTLAAWVNPTTTSAYQAIVSSYNTASSNLRFQMYLTPSAGLGASLSANSTSGVGYEGVGSVPAGSWSFVTVRFDSVTQLVSFFVNGSSVFTGGTGISSLANTTRPIYIGARQTNVGGTDVHFNGKIDEVQIFPSALSHAEIVQMYQDGNAGLGGPTRISAQDHVLGDQWDLFATEVLTDGSMGPAAYIDSATVAAAASTTIGITTPGTTYGNVTIQYSCSDTSSLARDFLVEYSTNGGSSFANATLVSTSSGSIAGSLLSMVDCVSGTSNNSFIWDSSANGVIISATVQIRITAQYPSGPSATTGNFTVDNGTDLCTAGLPSNTLTAANLTYENQAVRIVNCTITIDGPHQFTRLTLGDSSGSNDSVLTHSATTTSAVNSLDITTTESFTVNSDGFINAAGRGFLGSGQGGNASTAGRTTGNTTTGGSSFNTGASYAGLGGQGSNGSLSTVYGDFTNPTEPGGGGGGYNDGANRGGTGGGLVRIVSQGTIVLNGTISANGNGQDAVGGGGAGGGIYLNAATAFSGNGTITANGGTALLGGQSIGGGGGGRIAVHYGTSSFTGSTSVNGGSRDGSADFGGGGTVFFKSASQDYGDLYISNSLSPSSDSTPYPFHIRRSTSTGLTATVLTDTSANFTTNALTGLSLNPNTNQFTPFTIVSNTATTITVSGDMTAVATAGNSYAVARTTLDNFTISGTGKAAVDDFAFTVLEDLTLLDTAILTHSGATLSDVPQLNVTLGVLTINNGAALNATGRGFLGSGQGGNATTQGRTTGNVTTGGSDTRAGGSYGGRGGAGSSGTPTAAYGSITDPVEPGSGGGGFNDGVNRGGNGGGLVRITATSVVVNGSLLVNGNAQNAVGGGGAGGGLYINTGSLSGNGTISANGGNGFLGGQNLGGGGGGRIALYYQSNTFTGTLSAIGGAKDGTGIEGGAGTIYTNLNSQAYGDLLIDDGIRLPAEDSTPLPSVPTVFDNVTIQGNAKVLSSTLSTVNGTMLITDNGWFSDGGPAVPLTVGVLTINSGGNLTHPETDTSTIHKIDITVTGNMTVDTGSTVNVTGRGFLGGWQGANTTAFGRTTGNVAAGSTGHHGASHAGLGGSGQSGVLGAAYGVLDNPIEPGAGGGGIDAANRGGDGGGLIRLSVGGTLSVVGTIAASGNTASAVGGGGAGGAVYLDVNSLTGAGTISVAGGTSTIAQSIGGGGGGRIAIQYDTNTFSGTYAVAGGVRQGAGQFGGSGTLFLKDSALANGDLLLNNTNQTPAAVTPLFVSGQPTTYTFVDLSVLNLAVLRIDTPCSGTPALTITGTSDFSGGGTISNLQSGTCTEVYAVIDISTLELPTAEVNQAYSESISSAGGVGPHTFVCRDAGVTVDCSTVLPPGLSMSTAGVITGTPTTYGTYNFTVRATEASPGVGTDDQALSISVGNAPTAPTVLFVHNTDAQLGNSSPSGIDASPLFSAIFNDPDTTETALEYQIQVDDNNDFSSPLWDSGVSGTALSVACDQSFRCANINYAGTALSLNATTYYWRIKFFDELGIEGPFSATNEFTTDQAPTAPSNLFSNDSDAQSGLTNPVGILAGFPVFSAIFNDPDLGDTATQYRIQVSTTDDFSVLVWDSGAGGTNMTTCTEGTRCDDIIFGGTELERDETTYYWRIKFFDAAGIESPWSEDPISTQTFTMGTSGGSNIQLQQQLQQPVATSPTAPLAGATEVLGSTSVRYNWIDVSDNETGFRIINAEGQIVAETQAGQTSVVEMNLPPNTIISGRSVLAFNSVGESAATALPQATTAAPVSRPVLDHRSGDSVRFIIEPVFSSFPGQSAVRFELLVTSPAGGLSQPVTRTVTSDWIQENSYTFPGIFPDDVVQVRVVTRNQAGLQNEPGIYEDVAELSRRFVVTMGVFKKGTETLPRPMVATDIISVRLALESVGTDPANSVILNLPLPRYIKYRPGTMIIDARAGRNEFNDGSLGNQNGVSASWATVNPGDRHTLSFELAFDEEALRALKINTAETDEVITSRVQEVLAAANPLINLQASVSFAESDVIYMSPVVTLEPDVESIPDELEPLIEPEPDIIPEESPVTLPEAVDVIEEVLQQEFGSQPQGQLPQQPGAQPSSPAPVQTGNTISSSDNGSFNIGVSNEDTLLGLTGSATVSENLITFTGTTTEPFTVITLIFNNTITVIAVSDELGIWQTFVDAERLGIAPGQDAVVTIEAIAAKGDLRSERVQVGEINITRGSSGELSAEFDTIVSDSPALTVVREIQAEFVRVVEEQQPAIQTTLSVAAPIVVVSSVPLWGYLPYVPTMVYHFITYLLGLIGRKKKGQQRFYGVVYDSISKLPLPLAIVRIYSLVIPTGGQDVAEESHPSQQKLVATVVTDKLGRYESLLPPGNYRLEVSKPQYQFPSQIVSAVSDGPFEHVYQTSVGLLMGDSTAVIPDVPLDPVNAQRQWQLSGAMKKVWLAIQQVGHYLAVPVLLIGSLAGVATVAAVPDQLINWGLAFVYIALLAAQLRLKPKIIKAWGVVYDLATNAVLPLTTIQLIDPAYNKVVTSRLTDYQGRFSFLPEPGSYVVKASKPGYEQVKEVVESHYTDRQPIAEQVRVDKPDQRIAGDVAMKSIGA